MDWMKSQGNLPVLAKFAKTAVVIISVFMAVQQLGVAEEIVTAAFTLILGAIALAAGLAFGLGNQALAGEVTRRWYQEGKARRRGGAAPTTEAQASQPVEPSVEDEDGS